MRPSIPQFGYLYSVILLLIVLPTWKMGNLGYYPHSVGLPVRIAQPADLPPEEAPVIVAVHCAKDASKQPELALNTRPASEDNLPAELREVLTHRAHPVVYVQGDGCLDFGDIVRVIDLTREAWPDVTVLTMTDAKLKIPHARP